MDIAHHALIGGAGFVALSANDYELAGMAFVAGSVFPDLDVAFIALGKRFYLRNHQGPTHSFVMAPLYAILIASPAIVFLGFDWPTYMAALFGLWLHVLLDFTNTFGITLFWPVWRGRRSLDSVFFTDSVTWTLTVGFYLQVLFFPRPEAVSAYAALFASYVVFKYFLRAKVMRDLACTYAVPSSLNPFDFFVLTPGPEHVTGFLYNALSKTRRDEKTHHLPTQSHLDLAEKSQVFRDMREICKYLFITDAAEGPSGTTLVAHDLGVRNFGGRFGKTVLTFDHDGGLVDEMAHI